MIVIDGGGGWLRATSVEQLEQAIKRLESASVVKDGKTYLPQGILTNYSVSKAKDQ